MFDIIVPTYNRYEALPFFFQKMASLDKSLFTLWIVDDCSTIKELSAIPNWSNIHLIELTRNVGQAGARNYAIEKGTAPYIISLDDDAWFMEGSTNLLNILQAFETYPKAGCLMFNIATPNSNFLQDDDGKLLPLHVTCGCAYRRSAIEQIGCFNSLIQGQGEESDVSLKLYKHNWEIRSLHSIHVFHDFDPDSRTTDWYKRIRYKETRNALIVVFLHFPFLYLFWFIPGKAISQLLFAFKAKKAVWGTFFKSLRGVFDFFMYLPQLIKMRKPMPLKIFRYWRSLY